MSRQMAQAITAKRLYAIVQEGTYMWLTSIRSSPDTGTRIIFGRKCNDGGMCTLSDMVGLLGWASALEALIKWKRDVVKSGPPNSTELVQTLLRPKFRTRKAWAL